MKRSAFAALCGIAKSMVTKYGPYLVIDGDEVDATASLAALEGRLDEGKRRAALAALNVVQPAAAQSASPAAAAPLARSAKAEKDEVELNLKRLQYGREAGELVDAERVDAAARQAVATMREAFGNRRRDIAERVCLNFGLAPDRVTHLARMLSAEFEDTLGVFAREMLSLITETAGAPPIGAITGNSLGKTDVQVSA